MADSAEKQDHKAVEGTGLEVLQSGNPLVERKNAQDVEIVRESFEPMENVFRRHIKDDPNKIKIAKHRLWLDSLQREYPMPFVPYRVGVYIRFSIRQNIAMKSIWKSIRRSSGRILRAAPNGPLSITT